MSGIRVGQGFDIHQLAPNRRLVVGGVEIPHDRGLLGHSDADVLLHAICDALLGAAGLPDIGHYFPPSDPKFKDADSLTLLSEVKRLIEQAGYHAVINIDATIMAEKPKMLPHIPQMKARIASVLDIAEDQIGIKATTCESLGFVGREEGIAASAVCLIANHE
jgi:2-C-methyl-D-erythritol 2,4-cyclodiphosphate synthase